jgi:hypothetical protein
LFLFRFFTFFAAFLYLNFPKRLSPTIVGKLRTSVYVNLQYQFLILHSINLKSNFEAKNFLLFLLNSFKFNLFSCFLLGFLQHKTFVRMLWFHLFDYSCEFENEIMVLQLYTMEGVKFILKHTHWERNFSTFLFKQFSLNWH